MSFFEAFFNLLLLFFFVRLCTNPEREFSFNPFVSGPGKMTDSVLASVRSLFGVPDKVAALMVLCLVFLFKTLFLHRFAGQEALTVGGQFLFLPPLTEGDGLGLAVAFSLACTSAFFFRLWAVFFIVRALQEKGHEPRTLDSFRYFCRPFSSLSPVFSAIVLFFLHTILMLVLTFFCRMSLPEAGGGSTLSPFSQVPSTVFLLKAGWLAFLSVVDALHFLSQSIFYLLIGNLVFALLGWHPGVAMCSETVDMLMGRFRRKSPVAGSIDFRPVLFFLVVNVVYGTVAGMLVQLIRSPLALLGR